MRPLRHAMPFGAAVEAEDRVRFRLWAPDARRIELALEDGGRRSCLDMAPEQGGWFVLATSRARAGSRYRFVIDGNLRVPDPASRFQPDGVAGASRVVDPATHAWHDDAWRGRPWIETVLYELHIGAFTPAGTFESATERLGHLAALGITAIEVMPVATFAGRRGWGYDGVLPFAPHPAYGEPDAFKRFVDAAHQHGIQVLLDVVYNHFGPEGNYLDAYARAFFTNRHQTPWGDAINYDGADARPVREFFIHNALYWLEEYRLDGLRLDAVHAIVDDSEQHILDELAARVQAGAGVERHIHLVLENDANEARYLDPRRNDTSTPYAAQWNDDFHHACHTLVTGESDGYYADYADAPIERLSRCLAEGFAYQGERSRHRDGARRGEPSRHLPSTAFINFLQNHDQIGNRAFGERLATLADARALRAVTSVLLLNPGIPALFMGEEFASERPFLYFADFEAELAEAVRAGRRREFARFERFRDAGASPRARERCDAAGEIPDPMALETFERSQLDWAALDRKDGARWVEYHRKLLKLRQSLIVPRLPARSAEALPPFGAAGLAVTWLLMDGARLSMLANLGTDTERIPPAITSKLFDRTVAPTELIHSVPRRARHPLRDVLEPWSVLWYLEEPA